MSEQVLAYQKLHLEEQIHGFVQERPNSSALAMELCLSCTNPGTSEENLSLFRKIVLKNCP